MPWKYGQPVNNIYVLTGSEPSLFPSVSIIGNRFGFSLVELMITISVMGILASLAVPNVVAWRNTSQFNAAVREVKLAIEEVRMAALKTNLPASITFNNTNVFSIRTQTILAGVPAEGTVVTHQLAAIVTLNSNFASNRLTFTGRGLPANLGTVFVNHANGLAADIVVSFTGNSRVR